MKSQTRAIRYLLFITVVLAMGLTAFFALRSPVKPQEGTAPASTPSITHAFPSPSTQVLSPTVTIDTSPTFDPKLWETEQAALNRSQSICAQIWGSNLPIYLPKWLTTPTDIAGLATNVKYVYLAGELISHGYVDASGCPDGGLTPNGVSSTCGMEKAYNEVVAWQNQFDQEILTAAQENLVPAELIKRLFAQETQFWPRIDFAPPAYGLGNVTSPGIEPLFSWYPDIYQHTCIDFFSRSCAQPYSSLDLASRQNLRGYFISQHIHAYCPSCSHGIDLVKTKSSVDYFSKLIVANCQQVNLLLNNFGFSPRSINYEDTWRLTLTNYTVGAGCVEKGLEHLDPSRQFSWVSFTDIIDNDCINKQYIENITR